MTPEQIEQAIAGLEDGDTVVITVGEGYYQAEVRGRIHYDARLMDTTVGPLSIGTSRFYDEIKSIEVVSKGEPKWRRAKVISAELKGSKEPQYFVRTKGAAAHDWVGEDGTQVDHKDLENAVIVASEDS